MGRKKKQVIFEPKLDGYIETGKKKRYATYSSGAEKYGVGPWTFTEWAKKQVQQSVKENGLSLIWIFWMNIWKKKISKNQKGENDMPKVRKEIDSEGIDVVSVPSLFECLYFNEF